MCSSWSLLIACFLCCFVEWWFIFRCYQMTLYGALVSNHWQQPAQMTSYNSRLLGTHVVKQSLRNNDWNLEVSGQSLDIIKFIIENNQFEHRQPRRKIGFSCPLIPIWRKNCRWCSAERSPGAIAKTLPFMANQWLVSLLASINVLVPSLNHVNT